MERVISVSGRFGAGKSAFSVWVAHEMARRRGGVPIWANFDITGARRVYTYADLYDCEHGVIVLDELQGTVHSRQSNKNVEFLARFDQVRKSGSQVIVITQALHKIDLIVREMIDLHFDCEDRGTFEMPHLSRVTPTDLHTGRERPAIGFDRSASFGLYDHMQRAWGIVADLNDSKAPESALMQDGRHKIPVEIGARNKARVRAV